ncbi:hypothetical protein [Okeania sp. KiyG1]|uniref:hypothetical protein n=1 Tax=Okeania sp. KiyG1 TaxID=2720165 RepID=UPI0019212D8D|nr:hypothetical protein [Okeania sp. KiyG1]GGA32108.1 hypothetical protein CYANOKiyG1_48800 [Okeania sp. KiyG1]
MRRYEQPPIITYYYDFFPDARGYYYGFGASQNELLVCDGSDRSVSLFIKVSMGEIFSFGASHNDFGF